MTFEEIAAKINEQAQRKGWSRNPHYMQLGIYKETGELVQAIEHYNVRKAEIVAVGAPEAYANSVLAKKRSQIAKEFGDVIYFLCQTMKVFDPSINLDEAFQMTYESNEKNKKKTIDDKGNTVRK